MTDDDGLTDRLPTPRLLHPLAIGIVTAVYVQVSLWGLLILAFTNLMLAGVVALAVPVVYVVLLSAITRAMLGRARVWWNLALTATLIVFGLAVSLSADTLSAFGGVPVLPLTLGIGAALASLAAQSGPARVVGILAIGAQLVTAAIPLGAQQGAAFAQQSAADEADLARINETNTRPYVVPGLVVQMMLPSDYQTDAHLSRDPDAPVREGYDPEQGDITLSTAPLVAGQSIESEACRWIPDAGGSAASACDQLDADTWMLTGAGSESIVRIRDGSRIEISDGGHDLDELLLLIDEAELMTTEEFERWNSWHFERNKRV